MKREYDIIRAEARAATTAHTRHACARYDHVLSEWYNGSCDAKYEVWDNNFNTGGVNEETDEVMVFASNQKSECETFMQAPNVSTSKHPDLELRENGKCDVCDLHDKRKAAVAQGHMLPFYVVAWGVSRHYLGPWEGGTWGDDTEVLEVRRAFTLEQGLKHARELREAYPQPRFGIGSAANRGEPETHIRCIYSEMDPRMPVQHRASRSYE